ncbi:MAG: hypothetical protein QXW67_03735 [Candidatus Micrarchaeia archaeon]
MCMLSLLLSSIIKKRISNSKLTIKKTVGKLNEIKSIPIKLSTNIIYRPDSKEALKILRELKINEPNVFWFVHCYEKMKNK